MTAKFTGTFRRLLTFGVFVSAAAGLLLPSLARADKNALSAAVDARADTAWQAALKIWDWRTRLPGDEILCATGRDARKVRFSVERGVASDSDPHLPATRRTPASR